MNVSFGIALVLFGTWLTIRKIRTFVKGEQGDLGYDEMGVAYGIVCVICGIILIVKNT